MSTTPKEETTTTTTTTTTVAATTTTTTTTTASGHTTAQPLPPVKGGLRSNTSSNVDKTKTEKTEEVGTPTSLIEDSDTFGLAAAKLHTATESPEVTEPNIEEVGATKAASEGKSEVTAAPTGRIQLNSLTILTYCLFQLSDGLTSRRLKRPGALHTTLYMR